MNTLRSFSTSNGTKGQFHCLPVLKETGIAPNLERLPVSIRLVLESLMRNCDGIKVTETDVRNLANYNAKAPGDYEIPFVVARIVLQDFTGVPLLVDLAAMRSAVQKMGKDPKMIEPLVPVDLVVDHSVQVDFSGTRFSFLQNLNIEFLRNQERYEFLKWGMQAFDTFKVVPPGIGIVHQVNLEYLAKGVLEKDGVYYPDTLVGTDSHTTMINGLGVVGWGVGGIEAEAGMLGQPVTFLVPEVVGVYLSGSLGEGVTATDLALTLTQLLRAARVVGKFVEFYGPGTAALPVVDRAMIANMAPEYGATMGFFPIDEECVNYLRATGRSEDHCSVYKAYYEAQGLWGTPDKDEVDYSEVVELDLSTVVSSVAGPKRPQDRIELPKLKEAFTAIFSKPVSEGGFGKAAADLEGVSVHVQSSGSVRPGGGSQEHTPIAEEAEQKDTNPVTELEMVHNRPTPDRVHTALPGVEGELKHGSVLIAAITSCTNTSNPGVMLAAGLLAKKAVEKGLMVSSTVKASLAPGSRVVSDYLDKTGLQPYLDQLGFNLVGYGCTTCIGNSGPLSAAVEDALLKNDLVAASVLSGNRNFEARVHQSIKANFLMSPPLVVAFALAGHVNIDLSSEPLGTGSDGQPVFLRDIWPSLPEIRDAMQSALKPETFQRLYTDFAGQNPKWNEITASTGNVYAWDEASTYIQHPPFFGGYTREPGDIKEITGARPLGIFGDSVTTDHISPAGNIKKDSPAGRYLLEHGVSQSEFNSYGSRRGNDRIMTRGTFANVRIKNLMLGGEEGGDTLHQPHGEKMSIFDAAVKYMAADVPTIVIGGEDYGMGSSRDWAAKGTRLLGVRAVITKSFERIHRSNLIGMGVLPCTFKNREDYDLVKDQADATFDLIGISNGIKPQSEAILRVHKRGSTASTSSFTDIPVIVRLDTPVEIAYYRAGGILPYVLSQILENNEPAGSPTADMETVAAQSQG